MSALPTPKLVDLGLDDPLAPQRTAPAPGATASPAQSSTPRRARTKTAPSATPAVEPEPSLADEPLAAVFARVPESLAERLAETVRAVNASRPRRARVSQQDVLGVLVQKHLTPDDVSTLSEELDAYRRLLRR